MKKQVFYVVLMAVVMLTACAPQDPRSRLIGRWELSGGELMDIRGRVDTLEFFDNGTGIMSGETRSGGGTRFSWTLNSGRLQVITPYALHPFGVAELSRTTLTLDGMIIGGPRTGQPMRVTFTR